MKTIVWLDRLSADRGQRDEVQALVVRRMEPFAEKLERITVLVRDTHNRKGGAAIHCRTTAHLRSGDVITLSAHASHPLSAASNALERLVAAVASAIRRKVLLRDRATHKHAQPRNDLPTPSDPTGASTDRP